MGVSAALVLLFFITDVPASIPNTETLIREVQARQKRMDALRENYTFHQSMVREELDAHGAVRKTESQETELFFVNGHRVDRVVKKDGRDLTLSETRNQDERVRKEAQKFSKAAPAEGPEVIAISQVLQIIDVSSPRRTTLNSRNTLVFD